ncbi:8-oxoguanine glycosylase ogg1 [Elasticomyces elasticus]|nr:8-oxoguanine glycosylase ogg1 [Elasticomyces elasticus]
MAALRIQEWRSLPVPLAELCINTTLRCGQSFRWRKAEDETWSIALHGRILSLRQDPTHLHYRALFPTRRLPQPSLALPTPPSSTISSHAEDERGGEGGGGDDTHDLVCHYLNLTPDLTRLYKQWSAADPNFARRAPAFTGIRVLQQDAWEALVGFICSSNNNIIRISQMIHKLCVEYGPLIGELDGLPYHDFPAPGTLAQDGVEARLRALGFGYRAKYLAQTARMLLEKGDAWLDSLRNPERPVLGVKAGDGGDWREEGREGYRRAHDELLALQGVGPKVADCVCLMGLGWGEAVPVDTHVWQIAQRDYRFGRGKHSSLTKATYDAVGNKFRSLWGKEAGWAHSVLFTADLRAFSERLVTKTEVKEESLIKVEEDAIAGAVIKEEVTVEKTIKRELEGQDERKLIEIKANVVRKTKRRRKA